MHHQGVIELSRNPKQLEELKADPSLATAFVEELCRYHTGSSMAMKRVAKEDVEIGGKVIYWLDNLARPSSSFKPDSEQEWYC